MIAKITSATPPVSPASAPVEAGERPSSVETTGANRFDPDASVTLPVASVSSPGSLLVLEAFKTDLLSPVCFPDTDLRQTDSKFICSVNNPNGHDPYISLKSKFVDPKDSKRKETEYRFRFNPNLDRPRRPSIPVIGGINEVELVSSDTKSGLSSEQIQKANQGALRGVLIADPYWNARHRPQKAKKGKVDLKLEPFQKAASQAGFKALTEQASKSALIETPTGTGKTVIAWDLMDKYNSWLRSQNKPVGSTVFVVNSKAILKDAQNKLNKYYPGQYEAVRYYKDTDTNFDPKLVDKKTVAKKVMNSITAAAKPRVYFTSPRSLFKLLRDIKDKESISQAIFDEVHHLPAPLHRLSLKCLRDDHPDVAVAGYSATPFRTDGLSVSGHINNDTTANKSKTFSYSQREAWLDGYLPTVHIAQPRLPSIKSADQDPDTEYPETLNLGTKLIKYSDIWSRYQELRPSLYNGKTLILVQSTKDADKLAEYFQRQNVNAAVYHSHKEGSYQNYLAWNTGKWLDAAKHNDPSPEVLIAVDALKEGVDAMPAHLMICKSVDSLSSLTQIIGRGTRIAPAKTHLEVSDMAGITNAPAFLSAIMNYFKTIHSLDPRSSDNHSSYMDRCHQAMGEPGDELDLELFKLDSNIADRLRKYVDVIPKYLARRYINYEKLKEHDDELAILDEYIAKQLKLVPESKANAVDINRELGNYFGRLRKLLDSEKSSSKANALYTLRSQMIDALFTENDEVNPEYFIKSTASHRIIFKRLVALLEQHSNSVAAEHLNCFKDMEQILPEFVIKHKLNIRNARENITVLRNTLLSKLSVSDLFANYLTNQEFINTLSPFSQAVLRDIQDLESSGTIDRRLWFKSMESGRAIKEEKSIIWPGNDGRRCIAALYEAYCKIAERIADPMLKDKLSSMFDPSPYFSFRTEKALKLYDLYRLSQDFISKLVELGLHEGVNDPLFRLHDYLNILKRNKSPVIFARWIAEIDELLANADIKEKMAALRTSTLSSYLTCRDTFATVLARNLNGLAPELQSSATEANQQRLAKLDELIEIGSVIARSNFNEHAYQLRKDVKREGRHYHIGDNKFKLTKSSDDNSPVLVNWIEKIGDFDEHSFLVLSRKNLTNIESDYAAIPREDDSSRMQFLETFASLLRSFSRPNSKSLVFVFPADISNSRFFSDLQKYLFEKGLDVLGPFEGSSIDHALDLNNFRISALKDSDAERLFIEGQQANQRSRLLAAIYKAVLKRNPDLVEDKFSSLRMAMASFETNDSISLDFIRQCLLDWNNDSSAKYTLSKAFGLAEKYIQILHAKGLTLTELDMKALALAILIERKRGDPRTDWCQPVKKLIEIYIRLRTSSNEQVKSSYESKLNERIVTLTEIILSGSLGTRITISKRWQIGSSPLETHLGRSSQVALVNKLIKELDDKLEPLAETLSLQDSAPSSGVVKTIYVDSNKSDSKVLLWLTNVAVIRSSKEFDRLATTKRTNNPIIHLDPQCDKYTKYKEPNAKTKSSYTVVDNFHKYTNRKRFVACQSCCKGLPEDRDQLVAYLQKIQEEYERSQTKPSTLFNFVTSAI